MVQVGDTVENNYLITKKIGHGAFGEVYIAKDLQKDINVAVKIEKSSAKVPQLFNEARVIRALKRRDGFPVAHWYGAWQGDNLLIMTLLGKSLESLLRRKQGKFSIKTVVLAGIQMINRIEVLHSKNYIHRDIKPENFVVGLKNTTDIYLIDFGLSKLYRDPTNQTHFPYKDRRSLVGTVRYSSLNAHLGIEMSRRDDLESIGYLLVYLFKGSLPWMGQGTPGEAIQQRNKKIFDVKSKTSLVQLCDEMPPQFQDFIEYTRSLRFDEDPNYEHLRNVLREVSELMQFKFDRKFDWNIQKEQQSPTLKRRRSFRSAQSRRDGGSSVYSKFDQSHCSKYEQSAARSSRRRRRRHHHKSYTRKCTVIKNQIYPEFKDRDKVNQVLLKIKFDNML